MNLKALMTLLLAVAWLPLTAHCQLESLLGLEELQCQPAAASAPSGDSHCDDSCCGWETAQDRAPAHLSQLSAPIASIILVFIAVPESDTPAARSAVALAASPPGPARPWQFSLRAALPVRAPSLVS